MNSQAGRLSEAYFVLGSNINAEQNLPAAVAEITGFGTVRKISSVWETEPVGFTNQPNFLNAVLLLETMLDIEIIRTTLIPTIEQKLNRVRDPENKNGPRTIDVDLVLYNHVIHQADSFQLPDPDILTRYFLAGLLAEIAPHYLHPVQQRSLSEIARDIRVDGAEPIIRTDIKLQHYLSE